MNQCALCMTELHPEAVVCTGCGARKEERMPSGPKLLAFVGCFISLYLVPALAFEYNWGWFSLLLPAGIIFALLVYCKDRLITYWVRAR